MSTNCNLRRVSKDDIERSIADPKYLDVLLAEDELTALPLEEVRPRGLLGLLWRLVPITISQVRTDAALPDGAGRGFAPNEKAMDLDKAWHGLHFLFTGTAWEGEEPACFLVRGGEDVGDEADTAHSGRRRYAGFGHFWIRSREPISSAATTR